VTLIKCAVFIHTYGYLYLYFNVTRSFDVLEADVHAQWVVSAVSVTCPTIFTHSCCFLLLSHHAQCLFNVIPISYVFSTHLAIFRNAMSQIMMTVTCSLMQRVQNWYIKEISLNCSGLTFQA
jgi:hypothetical protein